MKIVSVVNHKGGVGKTTITVNLGAELAYRGNRVLLIDLDSQGNLTKATGVEVRKEHGRAYSIAEALRAVMDEEPADPNAFIYPTEISSNLDVVPCHIGMAETKIALNLVMARERILKIFLDQITAVRDYDYILIDNAPSIEVDFQNALVASTDVLIVTEADEFSTDGMESLMRQLMKIREYFNPDLKVAGVLINKADRRTNLCRDMIDVIRTIFGQLNVFETIIPSSVKMKESQSMKVSIKAYDQNNAVAKAISSFTDEFVELDR